MTGARVRVLLVVASPLAGRALERLLAGTPDIEVVGVAAHGREAIAMLPAACPDLVCADAALPLVDGLELTRQIMRALPCPILLFCPSPDDAARRAALDAGALDCIERPTLPTQAPAFVARLRMLARVPVIGRRGVWTPPLLAAPAPLPNATPLGAPRGVVAIGASTGGPGALLTILSALPADFPVPVVCVQHVAKGFLAGLVTWLDEGCRVRVRLARDGEIAPIGTALFPPEDHHLEVTAGGRVCLSTTPPRDGHRPSVTVLFDSVARAYGSRATAILLTGMGSDGASGLLRVRQARGETFAQDEASCVVFGMPRVAIELGAAQFTCSPEEIGRRLAGG